MSGYVFGRGSNVLEYWMINARGFAVRSRGARVGVVSEVVIDPGQGRASALVLRSPFLGRPRTVLAREVEAVDPALRRLEIAPVARPRREPLLEPLLESLLEPLDGLTADLDRLLVELVARVEPRLRAWGAAAAAFVRSQIAERRAPG